MCIRDSNYGAKIAFAGASNNTDEFYIQQDNTKAAYIWNEANKHITFGTNNTARMWLANNGNFRVVGISTFNSSVHVDGNINANGNIVGDNSTNISGINDVIATSLYTSDSIIHRGETGDNTKIRFPADDTVTVETNGSERLRITGDGKIGIGNIASPVDNVEIRTDAHGEGVTIKSTGNTSNALTFDSNRSGANNGLGNVYGRWNGTTVAQISFNAGSDTTDKNDGYIWFGTETAASNGNVNATERLRITSGGNIGIGTHNPQSYDPGAESLVVCGPGGTLGQSGITIVSGSDKYGCLYFGDGTGSSSYKGRVEYRHDVDVLQMGAGGAHGDLVLDANGDMFLRGDSTVYLVLGSAGDASTGGANNTMNWIRGNGNDLLYNSATGTHAWEVSGGEKMKLDNDGDLELVSKSSCRITLGSAGSPGGNDSNWIRGDSNNLMFNCADTSGDHIFEVAGTAKAKINGTVGVRAENTCKAWVCYKHDGGVSAIHDDFFVTSVSDEGTGIFAIQFDGHMGGEDKIAYQVGSHSQTPVTVGGVAYTPSYGSQNPWWSMESDWVRINLQKVSDSGNTYTDSEWWNLIAFGDAI